jgi:hypothetical protein
MSKIDAKYLLDYSERRKLRIFVNFANAVNDIQVCVFASDSISTLFKLLPKGNKIVLYQGKIIQSSLSFQKCEIFDQERIHVLFEEQYSMKFHMICGKSILNKRKDSVEQESESLARKEFSRMMDMMLLKIENDEKIYRDVTLNFQILGNDSITSPYYTCLNWKEHQNPNDKNSSNTLVIKRDCG